MEWKFKLSEARIEENKLVLGITAEGPYDTKVRSPKVVAVINSVRDNRRFPICVNSYFVMEDMKTCMVYAEYPISIDDIFVHERDCDYRISFDFMYGDEWLYHIPLQLERDRKVLERQGIFFEEATGELILKGERKQSSILGKIWKCCKKVLAPLYQIFTYLVALLLLPWYFIDAVASILLGISPTYEKNQGNIIKRFVAHMSWRYSKVCKYDVGITGIKRGILNIVFLISHIVPVKQKEVFFLSSRRNDLTGNFLFLYEQMIQDGKTKIKLVLEPQELRDMSLSSLIHIGFYAATAKIILIDDYTPVLSELKLRRKTKLIQLWHACGAFKTFGFSRTGKRGGPKQSSLDHRNYDYATVSSKEIRPFYAEGFGIAEDKVVATGVPRTDVFFDESYKKNITEKLQKQYPQTVGKKVILFAPTFRGNGKLSAEYPESQFSPVKFMEKMPKEYVLIIKHHPFVNMSYTIPDKWENRILDLSGESEINDLLFITDVLITDYSSVVFEAALLDIPMVMYAFDLRQYIASRDFYYDYEFFVPGKIVENFEDLVSAVRYQKYEKEKLAQFKARFFDDLDGKSMERVLDLIYSLIEENKESSDEKDK